MQIYKLIPYELDGRPRKLEEKSQNNARDFDAAY